MDLSPEMFIAAAAVGGVGFKVLGKVVDALADKVHPPKETIVRFSTQFEERFASIFEKVVAIDMATRGNDRIANGISELNKRFEQHDKDDALWHTKVVDRIVHSDAKIDDLVYEFKDHDKKVMEAVALQHQIKENTKR